MTITWPEPLAIEEPDWQADLADALQEIHDAHPEYEKATRYFEGTEDEKFLSPMTRMLLTGSQSDFRVNLAAAAVTAVTDRLEIGALTAEPPLAPAPEEEPGTEQAQEEEQEEREESEATRVLNEVFWHANELDIEAPEIHEKAVSKGDAYLFVWPRIEDGTTVGVDAWYNSPLSVRVLYDQENPRKKRLVIKMWVLGTGQAQRVRVNLYYPGTTTARGHVRKFISADRKKGTAAADFEPYPDEHTDDDGVIVFPWEGEDLPFFHFRTARPYGKPEHAPAYGSQDMLTKLVKNMMSTSDFAAFPQRYGLLDPVGLADDGDELDDDVSPEEANSQMIAGSGRMWLLRFMKSVGQFDAADVDQFLKPIDLVRDFMGATTRTPISYFRLGQGHVRVSGESQREDKEPLITKVDARQRAFAATWREAGNFALKLMGITATVTVRWAPARVISGKDGWEAVRRQQEAGVPVRQTLLEAGYTDSEVTSWGYTVANPDGPGMDLSGFAFPPPTPETAPATVGAGAPTPPAPGEAFGASG